MSSNDSMLEIYLYENVQLLEKLESLLLACEKEGSFSAENIAEIFRILHTVKGSSAMMNFDNVANLSHALEDLYGYLREHEARKEDYGIISDLTFETLDTIKAEIAKIQNNGLPDGDLTDLIHKIEEYFCILTNRKAQPDKKPQEAKAEPEQSEPADTEIKSVSDFAVNYYKAQISFEKESKMENIRAFGIVKSLENMCSGIVTVPKDLFGEHSDDEIVQNGFTLYMASTESKKDLTAKIRQAFFIEKMDISEMDASESDLIFGVSGRTKKTRNTAEKASDTAVNIKQNYMSVNLNKLDLLMDIVGEIVITEATVTKNPEVVDLKLEGFEKASRQLRKLTDELQDIVMSIRMVPVSATFHKMERIVRDMSAKTGKKARLVIIGEDTELDKNVLDNLSDPLMHIVRNAMDHGLETVDERIRQGKDSTGTITLEARNTGGDVMILISDDGRGLNKEALINKGIEKGLIKKPRNEVSDKEAYSLIFMPGFSTKDQVTEYSGRGVGMDVALKNIEKLGGSVTVNSVPGQGMSVQLRIPLTLAIIDGMQISVGDTPFIIPLLNIRESFKPEKNAVFSDPEGNEMIYIRDNCYPVIRLYNSFGMETEVTKPEDGIFVTVRAESQTYCLMVDDLIGEHQTVVKPLPAYISRELGEKKTIAGCTILGNGNISLIIDVNGLLYQEEA